MVLTFRTVIPFIICFLLFTGNHILAQDFKVGDTVNVVPEILNLRAEASSEAPIIDKLESGDILNVIDVRGEWLQVVNDSKTGFVSASYVEKAKVQGFYDWFIDGAFYGGLMVFILLFGGQVAANRVADKRYSGGFREDVVPTGKFLKSFFISASIGLLSGVGYAIYMSFKS